MPAGDPTDDTFWNQPRVTERGPVPCEQSEMPRAGGRLAHATGFRTLLFPKLTPNK